MQGVTGISITDYVKFHLTIKVYFDNYSDKRTNFVSKTVPSTEYKT